MPLEPQDIAELQISRNRASQAAWETFSSHRLHIQQVIERNITESADGSRDPGSQRTLAVLGAGNCNDLDLSWLMDRFAHIRLVDIDGQAVVAGVAKQGWSTHPAIAIDAPRDISGLGSEEHVALASRVFAESTVQSPQEFDVVLSSCVLSQIIEAANMQADTSDVEQTTARIQAIRRYHLQQMIQQLVVGGCGILVTDFCSSQTWPELLRLPDDQLADAAMAQLRRRNFFTGLNPLVICQLMKDDPEFQRLVSNVRVTRPWKWQLSQYHAFAVCAISFRRQACSLAQAYRRLV